MLRAARDAKTPVGVKAEAYMSKGELVPDQIILGIISERLEQPDCRHGYHDDGCARFLEHLSGAGAHLFLDLRRDNAGYSPD